jgi:PAS domain S-box-containing protein
MAKEKKELRNEFFDLCSEMLCILGPDRRVLAANKALCRALGYDARELASRALPDLVHVDDRAAVLEAFAAAASGEGDLLFVSRHRDRDGGYRPIEWRGRVGPESGFFHLVGTHVTERLAAERARHNLTARYEAILKEIPDIVAEVDVDKVYTWVNRAGYEFFGEDVVGKEASFFFDDENKDTYDKVRPLFDGSDETIALESWQRRHDGARRRLAWWCRGLKDESGRVVGALSTARDITDQKVMEAALSETSKRCSRSSRTPRRDPFDRCCGIDPLVQCDGGEDLRIPAGADRGKEARSPHAGKAFRDSRAPSPAVFRESPQPSDGARDGPGRAAPGWKSSCRISLSHTLPRAEPYRRLRRCQERRLKRQKLERTLEHATKMEAVGRLAGGIAHDFNNLLTALSGFAEVVLDELPDDHPLSEGAKETLKTCQRSTALVRRLLAVSRRQMLQPEVIDLNPKVAEIEKMLRSVLGEDIELLVKLQPELGFVRADQSQIEQVVLNLVVNARDAMPTGGRLVIQTASVDVDEAFVDQHLGLKSGPYVLISVSDTGSGMDRETLKHIFEPFFTTKERGKGTGLGLATVYGIVSQSEGKIWAYSEPGQGTTFRIYLPRIITRSGESEAASAASEPASRGSETVLVVEDENTVRMVAVGCLKKAGYEVLEASNAEEALRVAWAHEGPIQLVLTDVLMPGIHGPELVRKLEEGRPAIRALYMSGHADDALIHHGILEGGLSFLEKPFARNELTKKVREVLDGA